MRKGKKIRRFYHALITKLVLAWDPDYTKVTPAEALALEEAEARYRQGDVVSMGEINWD